MDQFPIWSKTHHLKETDVSFTSNFPNYWATSHTNMLSHLCTHTRTLFPNFFCLLFCRQGKLLRRFISLVLQRQRSLRMQNTSLRCQTARCGLSYLMLKGVVDVICMLHWCSNSSLNASSAGKNCDCMVGKQTSVLDDISLGLLNDSVWDAWLRTIITLLSLYFTWILPQSFSMEGTQACSSSMTPHWLHFMAAKS